MQLSYGSMIKMFNLLPQIDHTNAQTILFNKPALLNYYKTLDL